MKETKNVNDILDKLINVDKTKFSKRKEYNLKCLEKLRELIERFPDWRFTQIIFNVGLAQDRFYEEPDMTLKTLENVNF